jgi:hypothetical protein
MSDLEIFTAGKFAQLIIVAALASERDLDAVRQDAALFERTFLTDDLAGMTLEDAIDIVRSTRGHPKVPLLDWWESARLVQGSPRKELKLADALVARLEVECSKTLTFETLGRLAMAKMRARRVRELYAPSDTPEAVRARRARASGPRQQAKVAVSKQALSDAFLKSVEASLGPVLAQAWRGELEPEQVIARVRALADVIAPEAVNVLLDHLGCGELQETINRLNSRLRRLKHGDEHNGAQIAAWVARDDVTIEEETNLLPSTASALGLREDDSNGERAIVTLIAWLDRHGQYVLPKFNEQDGLLRFSSTPRDPHVAQAYELAGDHPAFQRELRARLAQGSAVRR